MKKRPQSLAEGTRCAAVLGLERPSGQTWVEWVTGADVAGMKTEVASFPLHMQRILRPYVATVASLKTRLQQTPGWSNFVQGLNSPDPEQRRRFRAMARQLSTKDFTLEESQAILQSAEVATKRRGRKFGSKRHDDAVAHQAMRRLKEADPVLTKSKAAHIVAEGAPLGRATRQSVEKRIARTYPWEWDVK